MATATKTRKCKGDAEELKAAARAVNARWDAIKDEYAAIEQESSRIRAEARAAGLDLETEMRRDDLRQLVGQTVRYRWLGQDLSGKQGVLTEVRRSRCSVEFDGVLWNLKLESVCLPDEQPRHYTIVDQLR